ncbi:Uncharacterised protein [Sebaldella termitidis]|jgi:hypothetical protein|uniref:Uncharacterized protein n=1 Tax=Sebaldella termitidis (strain ATCC 33386 / NCTC 11300) TaxID=526218 RepID=D1AQP9_SEBTE|nr:hypothetical protein [Sebaldella termitidis]ACZ10309.1 hypothetical protein Sterm_3470 [Sebaldella termitidis ATCC 33386]SUI25648.1 Uncharacterised protein [Sebaldella termitidis]
MSLIGDIIDDVLEAQLRKSIYNTENRTVELIENHETLKKILIESMLESYNKNKEIEKQIEYLHFKIDKIEKLLLEILNK